MALHVKGTASHTHTHVRGKEYGKDEKGQGKCTDSHHNKTLLPVTRLQSTLPEQLFYNSVPRIQMINSMHFTRCQLLILRFMITSDAGIC